jgi:hypothetical protein
MVVACTSVSSIPADSISKTEEWFVRSGGGAVRVASVYGYKTAAVAKIASIFE